MAWPESAIVKVEEEPPLSWPDGAIVKGREQELHALQAESPLEFSYGVVTESEDILRLRRKNAISSLFLLPPPGLLSQVAVAL